VSVEILAVQYANFRAGTNFRRVWRGVSRTEMVRKLVPHWAGNRTGTGGSARRRRGSGALDDRTTDFARTESAIGDIGLRKRTGGAGPLSGSIACAPTPEGWVAAAAIAGLVVTCDEGDEGNVDG
jgi:hypothetical protein